MSCHDRSIVIRKRSGLPGQSWAPQRLCDCTSFACMCPLTIKLVDAGICRIATAYCAPTEHVHDGIPWVRGCRGACGRLHTAVQSKAGAAGVSCYILLSYIPISWVVDPATCLGLPGMDWEVGSSNLSVCAATGRFSDLSSGDLLRRGFMCASADIGRCRPISLARLGTDVKSPYLTYIA